MRTGPIEIEVDSVNANLAFRPLKGRIVRGAFNARNIKELEGGRVLGEWPDPVPGQRIGIDPETGTAYVAEPLHGPEHRVLRDRIHKRGYQLPPEREEFKAAHVPTWLYWIKRAVESGAARVVSGSLPEVIDGTPDTDFITKGRPTSNDRLAAAIQAQTEALERMAAAFEKLATSKR